MVYAIFNNAFIVLSPDSNKIAVVAGGSLRSVMISFAYSLKKFQLILWKRIIVGHGSYCVAVAYLVGLYEITPDIQIILY